MIFLDGGKIEAGTNFATRKCASEKTPILSGSSTATVSHGQDPLQTSTTCAQQIPYLRISLSCALAEGLALRRHEFIMFVGDATAAQVGPIRLG
jgi:hypothetical protein